MKRLTKFSVPGRPSRKPRPSQDPRTGRRIADPEAMKLQNYISDIARLNYKGRPYTGPVILRAKFIFDIPSSWPLYLRMEAERGMVDHPADPDLDQLIKQVKDAMSGIVYVDDNQVTRYDQPLKRYGSPSRSDIEVWAIDQTKNRITPGQKRLEKKWLDDRQLHFR